ncbi:MAG: 3-isopropylmalate dehydratase small subunit [Opitutales bacterium]
MALAKIIQVTGRGVFVPGDDIDTDRIIPARYLKCLTFEGLGQYAFYDERAAAKAAGRLHPLDDPLYQGASVLLSGSNFGCGSSREHAPQSLYRFGIRAVLAESFAEIFFGNAITLGMPCLVLPEADIEKLAGMIERDPQEPVVVNVAERRVTCGGREFVAHLPDSAHEALISGKWDAIADLLEGLPEVERVTAGLAYVR